MGNAAGIKIESNEVEEYMEEIFKGTELLAAQNQRFEDAEALQDAKELSSTREMLSMRNSLFCPFCRPASLQFRGGRCAFLFLEPGSSSDSLYAFFLHLLLALYPS